LILGDNNLNGTIPSELGLLTNLEKIFLWSNNLSGSIPSELFALPNLSSHFEWWLKGIVVHGEEFNLDSNLNLYALCDAYFDRGKIDIPCDPRVPSAAPSITSSPTLSSLPTITSLPSAIPTSTSAPSSKADCSCEPGQFKFELELRTDLNPWSTSWQIEDENGDILVSESGYYEQFTTFNYEYCLPVGCYDFVIYDWRGDGLCCFSDYLDDDYFFDYLDFFLHYYGLEEIDDFDGYYKGIMFGRKEVFNGGQFEFDATEHFCGEDLCPFATHYPSTSPSSSSRPSISPQPSPLPSASPQPSIINDDYYYYVNGECSNEDACPEDQFCNYDYTTSGSCEDCALNDLCDNIGLPSLGVADCQSICESDSSSAQKDAPTSKPTTVSLNIETLTSTVLKFFESIVTFFKNLLPL